MNRTNSVEPTFSQPLQGVSYHQLLQNKTKIEDELYQTQRQLRRKEGEYLKKIAVYEQKIDQLEEQLEEFDQREETTKSMYEKILSALNAQDKSTYHIDMERVQEMIQSMAKGTHFSQGTHQQPSPTNSERSLNSSFRKGRAARLNNQSFANNLINEQQKKEQQQYQIQIDGLEHNIALMSDNYQKSKQQLSKMEKENKALENQVQELQSQLELNSQEAANIKTEAKQIQKDLKIKVKELEQQITHQSQKPQKINQNVQTQYFETFTVKERDALIKQRESISQSLKEAESQVAKLKKQMSKELCNSNDNNKRMRQRTIDLEKELQAAQREETTSNVKIHTKAKNGQFTERKSSTGNIISSSITSTKITTVNVGSKEQQVIVDIQPKKNSNNVRVSNQRSSGGATTSYANKKQQNTVNKAMHQPPQPISININNESEVIMQQNQQLLPMVNLSGQNSFDNSKIVKKQKPAQFSEQQLINLDETQQVIDNQFKQQSSQNGNKMFQRRNFFDDSIIKSNNGGMSTKSNNQLQKYINISTNNKDPLQDSDICNNGGTTIITCGGSRSVSQQPRLSDSRSASQHQLSGAKHLSQERSPQQIQRALLSHIPSNRYLNDGDKALLSSIEIEHVVRRMLDQVYLQPNYSQDQQNQQQPLMPSQYHNIQQTPSQNVSFSMKKQDNYYNSNNSSKNSYTHLQQQQFTIDREFLTKLENSLRKLAKSNEKIKQIMKEKELFEKQCQKLKQKVKQLKEDKGNLLLERESLIQQNHKMECRLKQAQVILNLDGGEGSMQNNTYGNGNNTIYEMSRGSSQKTLAKHFQGNRDVSPGQQSNLTLNIIHETSQDRYKNPPMSCRVNDSYDISLRLMNHDKNGVGTSFKKAMFHNTLDKSLLDQSLLTIKRDIMFQQQQQLQVQNQQFNHPRQHSNSQYNKFLPQSQQHHYGNTQQSLNSSTFRGKTPTLQINLSQSPIQNELQAFNHQQRNSNNPAPVTINMQTSTSERVNDSGSVLTSRNFSRSTTNLLNKKSFQHQYQNTAAVGSSQQTARQLFKYQSNRDATNLRQGQQLMNKLFSTSSNNPQQQQQHQASTNNNTSIQKTSHNYSSIYDHSQNDVHRDKSPQPFTTTNIQQQNQPIVSQASSVNILRRMNSTKAKDRYYTNKRNGSINEISSARDQQDTRNLGAIYQQQQVRNEYMRGTELQQIVTFDEEDDYFNDQTNQDLQQKQPVNQSGSQQYEDYSDEDQDTDENNLPQYSVKSESSLNIKLVPLPKQSRKLSVNSQEITHSNHTWQQPQSKQYKRKEEGVIPSDEREDDEESVQYKLLNNSNFVPSMHSRYANDDSQC